MSWPVMPFMKKVNVNLVLWLDSTNSDSKVYRDATHLSQWSDISGNGNHAIQTNNTYQPETFSPTGFVYCVSGDYMYAPRSLALQQQPFTMVLVKNDRNSNTGTWGSVIAGKNSATPYQYLVIASRNTIGELIYTGNGSLFESYSVANPNNDYLKQTIEILRYDGNVTHQWDWYTTADGDYAGSSVNTLPTFIDNWNVGGHQAYRPSRGVYFYELRVYDKYCTNAEITALKTELKTKYSIA
jgi:hypothetical protein